MPLLGTYGAIGMVDSPIFEDWADENQYFNAILSQAGGGDKIIFVQ